MELPSLPLGSAEWIFVVLTAVVLLAPVGARRLRLPGILGLIVAGTVVGPNVLGLVERSGFVEVLGGAGLLFLMFMAGLELDLRSALNERRRDTLVFGAMTFAFPLLVGVVALLVWGFAPLAAVLIASCWSSHTLVTYPIFQRLRIVQHRAVATAIGATLVTNVSALLVLAVVVALEVGGNGPASWVVLGGGLALLVVATLWGLPRLARWFFAGLGGDRLAQVLFVLLALFAASALASLVGIEAIVGAFFAGLGLNEHVPKLGVLGERLEFLGESLLVPVFLVSVGMLIDPAALFGSPTVLALAATFSLQSLGGKFLAAYGFGRLRRYHRDEIGTLLSLTGAEAAATLAAIFVGFQVGLFGQEVVDAVVLVIMVTCLTSSVLADRFAPRLVRPEPSRALGSRVVVPVANPATAGMLTTVAAALASADSGTVVPISVLGRHLRRQDVEEQRELLVQSEAAALRAAVEARSRIRIDDGPVDGIVHEVAEQGATSVLLGWKGYASRREHLFGSVIDDLVDQVDVPVVLCRPGADEAVRRIVLVPGGAAGAAPEAAQELARDVAGRLSRHLQRPVAALALAVEGGGLPGDAGPDRVPGGGALVGTTGDVEFVRVTDVTGSSLARLAEPGDLFVIARMGRDGGELERLAADLRGHTIVVVTG